MDINFDPQMESAVNAAIADGKFSSQEELIKTVVADYLETERQKQWLRNEIDEAMADDSPGYSWEEVETHLSAKGL